MILHRHKKMISWNGWLKDSFSDHGVVLKTLKPQELESLSKIQIEQSLDFDDAYQYVVAKTENLHLVSFDRDFDKTDLKRLEPLQALEFWRSMTKS